jgi:hypothetical protein
MKSALILFCLATSIIWSTPAAKVSQLTGHAQYRLKGGHWKEAKPGTALEVESEIQTGPRARLTIAFPNGSTLALSALTRVVLDKHSVGSFGSQVIMNLHGGTITANIARYKTPDERNYFQVRTPTVVAGVRGTIEEVSYSPDRGTQIRMIEHAADVIDRRRSRSMVPEGGKTHATKDGSTPADKMATKENTSTLDSKHASTDGEHDVSLSIGDFIYSAHTSDFIEFTKIYEKLLQDVFSANRDAISIEKF